MKKDDVLADCSPCGGGFGRPLERDPQKVLTMCWTGSAPPQMRFQSAAWRRVALPKPQTPTPRAGNARRWPERQDVARRKGTAVARFRHTASGYQGRIMIGVPGLTMA